MEWPFSITLTSSYLLFVIIGNLLCKTEIPLKIRVIIYIIALLGLLVHIFGTYYLSLKSGEIVSFFKEYDNLPCVLYSVGVFVFIQYSSRKIKSESINRFFASMQNYTFEIYLLHRLVHPPITKVLTKYFSANSMMYVILLTVITIPLCIMITFILRKIPLVKHIVP